MTALPDLHHLGTILGVWAHPDDEAYLMGGLMAACTDAGQHVACVTATYGDAGETSDPDRWPRHRLAEIRRTELAASLSILGVDDHDGFGLPDGGLDHVNPAEGIALVEAAMDRVRPDTVLTFGLDGMTGHPDHRTVAAWTVAAFRGRAGPDDRLLAATKTPAWLRGFEEVNAEVFAEGAPCTQPEDLGLSVSFEGDLLDRKVRALEAQASQTAGLISMLGREEYARWARDEFWADITPMM